MPYAIGFLLMWGLIPFIFARQKCENNATYLQKIDFCSCPPGYIGRTCNITAYELKQTDTKIPVSNKYTFAYFEPEQKMIYRFLLTFCPANKTQDLDIMIFAQEEQKNGDIDLLPKKQRQTIDLQIGGSQDCKQILSTVLVSVDKNENDQIVKIILGIKLTGKSVDLKDQYILVKCQTNSIFTVSFLATILITFLVIVTVFLIISVIFIIRKKLIQRRAQEQEKMKKMNCVNQLMPTKKYENLIQQQTQSGEYDVICSICLCDFEKGQDARKTPCGHIYHSKCLQSWCNAHLNCPICRKDFQQEQQQKEAQQIAEQALQPDTTNIRQPIL